MNRNEQVNGEKMWEYISNIGKALRKYRTEIAVGVVCSVAIPVFVGCAEIGESMAEGFREGSGEPPKASRDYIPDGNTPTIIIIDSHDHGYDDWYWRFQNQKAELKKIEEQQRHEGARIRAHTQKMLREMELKRKLREQR